VNSIRRSLTSSLLAGAFIALVIAGIVLYATMSRALVSSYDDALLSKARSVGMLLEFTGEAIELEDAAEMLPSFD